MVGRCEPDVFVMVRALLVTLVHKQAGESWAESGISRHGTVYSIAQIVRLLGWNEMGGIPWSEDDEGQRKAILYNGLSV